MDMTKNIILILIFLLIANCSSSKSASTKRVLNFSKPSKQMNRKAPEQNFELIEKAEKKKKKKKKKKNKVASQAVIKEETPIFAIQADPKPKEPFIKTSKVLKQKKEFVQPEKMFAKDPEQPKNHKKFKLEEFFKVKKFDTKPETPALKIEPNEQPVIKKIMSNREMEKNLKPASEQVVNHLELDTKPPLSESSPTFKQRFQNFFKLNEQPVVKPVLPTLKTEPNEQPVIKPIMSNREMEKNLKPASEQVVNHLELDTKPPLSESSPTFKQRFQNVFKFKSKKDSTEITEFNDQNIFPDLRSIPVKPEKYNNHTSINQIYEDEIKVDLEPANTNFSSSPTEEDIIKKISLPEEELTVLQVEELDDDEDEADEDEDDLDDNK